MEILDRLRHNPHILKAEDFGEQNDIPYLVMEYAPGGDLSQHMRGLSLQTVADYLSQIADALDYAHAQKPKPIIHRDLKPTNLLFDEHGKLLLADFGIAHEDDYTLTYSATSLGTPEYMAPEQFFDAKRVGKEADIYSLGVIAFQLVTGRLPFGSRVEGRSFGELEMGHRNQPLPQIGQNKRELLPTGLQATLEKAMAKEPKDRYRTAKAFATAFKQALVPEKPAPVTPPPTEAYSADERRGNPPLNPVKPPQNYYPNPPPQVPPPAKPRIVADKHGMFSSSNPMQIHHSYSYRKRRNTLFMRWIAGSGLLVVAVIAALLTLNTGGRSTTPTPIAKETIVTVPPPLQVLLSNYSSPSPVILALFHR